MPTLFLRTSYLRKALLMGDKSKGSLLGIVLTLLCQLAWVEPAYAVQDTTTNFQYDAQGNLTHVISPLWTGSNPVSTDYIYDDLDRLAFINQAPPGAGLPLLPSIELDYDGQDRLTWVSDPKGNNTVYNLTGLGDNTASSSPDSGGSDTTYDAAGNVKTHNDARGKVTTYTYDALNRLTNSDYPTGTDTLFTYDTVSVTGSSATGSVGKLTRIDDEAGVTVYGYDDAGRLTSKIQRLNGSQTAWIKSVTYAYGTSGTAKGKLASMTYPSGLRINYSYDSAGHVSGLTYNPVNSNGVGTNTTVTTNLLTNIKYSPTGQFISGAFGNHTTANPNLLTRETDLDGRIYRYPLGRIQNNGTVRTLIYDPASRITDITHTGTGTGVFAPANFNQTVSYDNLDRINSFTGSGGTLTYSYDANNNRASKGTDAYTVDPFSNQLQKTSPTAFNRLYDAAGNLTDDGNFIYTYSDRGRLSSVKKKADNTITNFAYNGLEQRTSKTNAGVGLVSIIQYVYDEAGHLIGEYDYYGRPLQETVYLGDMPIAVLTQTYTNGTATVTVDNATTANVAVVGSWPAETTITGYFGTNYQSHVATTTTTDSFTWKVALPSVGKYYFLARWTANATRASNATYTITGTDGVTTRSVDQRSSGNTWYTLGMKANQTAGNVATVKLGTSSLGSVSADAVMAIPVTVTTTVNYLFADHLNAPRVITRASGNQMVWRWDKTDPFGVVQPDTNPSGLGVFTYNPRFPGQVYDTETGLNYNVHRTYDSSIGSYTQSDPIGLKGGWNTYAYVNGNPVNYTDPKGLAAGAAALCFIPGIGPVSCAAAGAATGAIICALNPQLCKKAIEGCFDSVGGMFNKKYIPKDQRDPKRFFDKGQADRAKERSRNADGNATCEYCDVETTDESGHPNSAQTDHIKSHATGGTTTDDNANNSCATCNGSKGAKELGTEWIPPNQR